MIGFSNTLNFALAARLFAGGRQNSLVAFIARIAMAGVALAVAILIVVLSVMNGFDYEFRHKILGLVPHASLVFATPNNQWQDIAADLQTQTSITNVLPYVELSSLIIHGVNVQPLQIQGVDYSSYKALMGRYVEPLKPLDDTSLVLGAGVAKKLSLEVGDKIRLLVQTSTPLSATDTLNGSQSSTKTYVFNIAGILKTGTEIDAVVGIIALEKASVLAGLGGGVQGIHIQVDDVFAARNIASRIVYRSDQFSRYTDWTRSYGNLYVAIQLSRQMVVALLAIIVAVGVFNIFVTLAMVVRYKHGDIAILRTIGLTKSRVRRVFIYQGFLIAIPGCLIGVVSGAAIAYFIPEVAGLVEQVFHIEFLSTEVYPIDYLPSKIVATDLLVIVGVTLIMTFIATIFPARKASNLQPAKVLNDQTA